MAPLVILKAVTGEQAGREFVCSGRSQVVIGRSRSCSLRLADDPTVSRHHCLLEVETARVRVQDLGSKNGTFLNGELIGQRELVQEEDATLVSTLPLSLRTGDELRVGHNVFVVELHDGAPSSLRETHDPSLVLV